MLTEHEGEWESDWVEEGKKLDAQVHLAGSLIVDTHTCLKTIDCLRLLSIDDENLTGAPHTSHEFLLIKLHHTPRVLTLQVSLLLQMELVQFFSEWLEAFTI